MQNEAVKEDVDKIIIGFAEHIGIYVLTEEGKAKSERVIGGKERVMRFSLISRQLRWLQGEVLTVLEASIDDERKLRAVKELVKDQFSSKISWIYELCGTPHEPSEQDGLGEPLDTTPPNALGKE